MWYITLGYLLVSAPFAILFWLILIVAKRKDESNAVDVSEEQPEDTERELSITAW